MTGSPSQDQADDHSQDRGPEMAAFKPFEHQGCNYLEAILNNANTPIFLKTADFRYIFMNREFERLGQVSLQEVKGRDDFFVFPQPVAELFRAQDEEVIARQEVIEFEETIALADGLHTFITAKFPLFDSRGAIVAVGGICTDITARKQTEKALRQARQDLEVRVAERTAELDQKTKRLVETNIALEILLEKRDRDKVEFEDKVRQNIEKLIRPYLEKLQLATSDDSRQAILAIIQANLDEITSSFPGNYDKLSVLTPAQMQVADLIKHGHTTKEIAYLLNLSPSTVACHRQEIRKRLSLTNRKINLQSALTSAS